MHINTDTLNVAEAAAMLHVHEETVKSEIRAGAIPASKPGRSYVILRDDLLAYLRNLRDQQMKARTGLPVRRGRTVKPIAIK